MPLSGKGRGREGVKQRGLSLCVEGRAEHHTEKEGGVQINGPGV